MNPALLVRQFPVLNPCDYCHREISDPDTLHPSPLYGTPDREWLTHCVVKLAEDLDKELSFGPIPGADIPLCVACRDGLFETLSPDTILDYRDGGSSPKIVSGRGFEH